MGLMRADLPEGVWLSTTEGGEEDQESGEGEEISAEKGPFRDCVCACSLGLDTFLVGVP